MALINFLKFSDTSGAIIADEEVWTTRFRRRLHTDNLHSLLDEEMSDTWNMEIAYGGVGYPSVHREVVNETRAILKSMLTNENEKPDPPQLVPQLVKDVARIAFDCYQKAMRRRIDQKLQFQFGFTTDDLHRGYYEQDQQKVEIKNDEVKKKAKKMSSGEKKDVLLKHAMDTRAAIFGYDPTYGIIGFYLDSENGILAYNFEGFDAIGTGKYASGMIFGKMFGAQTLAMRQAGFKPAEGILELVRSALSAQYHFKEVGGNLNFVLLDSARKSHKDRYREIFDNQARLTTEIVKAFQWEELDRSAAISLIDALLFSGKEWEKIEKKLFSAVKNNDRFQLLLRNYKLDEVDKEILPQLQQDETRG